MREGRGEKGEMGESLFFIERGKETNVSATGIH